MCVCAIIMLVCDRFCKQDFACALWVHDFVCRNFLHLIFCLCVKDLRFYLCVQDFVDRILFVCARFCLCVGDCFYN